MSKYLASEYFPLGRMLMYPLLQIGNKFEYNCYLYWKSEEGEDYGIGIDNFQVMVLFLQEEDATFEKYKQDVILKSNKLVSCYSTKLGTIFVFDLMEKWGDDVFQMLQGKYSRFSGEAKKLIRNFYNDFEPISKPLVPKLDKTKHMLHMAFHPDLYFEVVGEDIGVHPDSLARVGELMNKIEKDRETLCANIEDDCSCVEVKEVFFDL